MHNGLSFRIEVLDVDRVTQWCFVLYDPSGNVCVFSPHYRSLEELAPHAKVFLFNYNHAGITITDIDRILIPDTNPASGPELAYRKMYQEAFGNSGTDGLRSPRLRLVVDNT